MDGLGSYCFVIHVVKALGMDHYSIEGHEQIGGPTTIESRLFSGYDAASVMEEGLYIVWVDDID